MVIAAQAELAAKLDDFHELRIADMDRAGIDISVLSPTGPSVQGETDAAQAASRAIKANDYLAGQIARNPKRLAGLASLAMLIRRRQRVNLNGRSKRSASRARW